MASSGSNSSAPAAAGGAPGGTVLEVARHKFEALRVAIDAETAGMESLNQLAARVGVARSTLVLSGAGFLFAFIFLGFGAQFFSNLLGMAYPVYASFKAIESADATDDTQWLTYWVVYGCFSLLECFLDTVLFWFPFYFTFKVGALAFLQAPQQLEVLGNDFVLKPEAVQNLGLVLHELATNSVKYGALSAPEGKITIEWTNQAAETGTMIRFVWTESGGPPVKPPNETGFGTTVTKTHAAASFGGHVEVDFRKTGLVWMLTAPRSTMERQRS